MKVLRCDSDLNEQLLGSEGRFLNVDMSRCDDALNAIASLGSSLVATLNVSENSNGDAILVAVARELVDRNDSPLTMLTASNSAVSDAGVGALCDALDRRRATATLNVLTLSMNGAIRCAGAVRLSNTLRSNRSLAVLTLAHCQIGDDGAVALADALRSAGCALAVLNLNTNDIGEHGIVALFEALAHNDRLAMLHVLGNERIDLSSSSSSSSTTLLCDKLAALLESNRRLERFTPPRRPLSHYARLSLLCLRNRKKH
jgi:Leucine Rich repeat